VFVHLEQHSHDQQVSFLIPVNKLHFKRECNPINRVLTVLMQLHLQQGVRHVLEDHLVVNESIRVDDDCMAGVADPILTARTVFHHQVRLRALGDRASLNVDWRLLNTAALSVPRHIPVSPM
jgi:hypothetical protein